MKIATVLFATLLIAAVALAAPSGKGNSDATSKTVKQSKGKQPKSHPEPKKIQGPYELKPKVPKWIKPIVPRKLEVPLGLRHDPKKALGPYVPTGFDPMPTFDLPMQTFAPDHWD